MKQTIQLFIACCLLILTLGSCKKAAESNINPADSNALQKVLTIQGGSLGSGTFPTATTTGSEPIISAYQTSGSTNPGAKIILPFNYTSTATTGGYKALYVQVNGATNGFFTINNLNASGSATTGTILINITVPSNVNLGNFSLIYSLVDMNGNISTFTTTAVVLRAALTCSTAQASGSEGLTFTTVQMGSKGGTASVDYDTYSVPDRIDVYQGNTWLTGTGTNPGSPVPPQCDCSTPLPGFVGQAASLPFTYNPGAGQNITVVVSGCLGGGTAWDWSMTCP